MESVREQFDELAELQQELEQGVIDQQEAEARTAAQLDKLADAMDDSAQQSSDEANELSETIEQLQNQAMGEDQAWDPSVNELADALREQRFDDASQQLEELSEQLEQLPP